MSQQQRPFQFFSIPLPSGNWLQPTQQTKEPVEPPARIRIALSLLREFTAKQSPVVAVNDMTVDWRDGQQLTCQERNVQNAACEVLEDYMRGRLKKSSFEREGPGLPTNKKGFVLNCPSCHPKGWNNPDCPICRGAGEVLAFQVIAKGNQ